MTAVSALPVNVKGG